jgi:aryl-alcohol dehydrogenase-like predicted oxidoreductase
MQDHKSPDALGWLKAHPDKAAVILGPTRHEMLQRGVNVLEQNGAPKRVGALLKRRSRASG